MAEKGDGIDYSKYIKVRRSDMDSDPHYYAQVIQEVEVDGKRYMRVFEIKDMHLADSEDPLTTIEITGRYTDNAI